MANTFPLGEKNSFVWCRPEQAALAYKLLQSRVYPVFYFPIEFFFSSLWHRAFPGLQLTRPIWFIWETDHIAE